MTRLKHLLVAALFVLPLAACDEGEGTRVVVGTVRGNVSVEGTGLDGVTVQLSGAVTQSATTAGGGNYTFNDVPEGSYAVVISNFPAGVTFAQTAQTVNVSGTGAQTADFSGQFIRTSSIIGSVVAGTTAIPGVTVQLSGTSSATTQTDAQGQYSFTGLRAGNYTITIAGVPAQANCPVTQQEQTLEVGQAAVVTFACDRELTATVAIKSITVGNTNTPVNPNNVSGQIDVTVTYDAQLDRLTAVRVLVDGEVVGEQTFGGNAPEFEGDLAAPVDWVVPIITDECGDGSGVYDECGGDFLTPHWTNGDVAVTAEVSTVEGGEGAATTSQTLRLNNADKFVLAELTPEVGFLLGTNPPQLEWGGGDLDVIAALVSFTGRDLASATAALFDPDTDANRATAAGTVDGNMVSFTFEDFTTPDTDVPTGNGLRVTAAQYVGQSFPGSALPQVLREDGVRMDNIAPDPGFLNIADLRDPDHGEGLCCGDNWVNSGYEWATVHEDMEDLESGVDPDGISYYQGAGITLLNYTDFDSGPTPGDAGIEPSAQHTAYSTVAEVCDVVLNCAAVLLSGDGDINNLTTWGLDDGPPTGTRLAASVQHMDIFSGHATSPFPAYAGETFQHTATDAGGAMGGPAGFLAGWQLYGTHTQFDTDGETCLIGLDPLCINRDVPRAPLAIPADGGTAANAYFILDVASGDQAGNIGDDLGEAWVLVDDEAPEVGTSGTNPTQSELVGGGSYTWTRNWTENLDAQSYFNTVTYEAGFGSAPIQHNAATEVGTPFDTDLETSGTVEATESFFIRSLDWVLPFFTHDAATGTAQAETFLPETIDLHVRDAAANLGTRNVTITQDIEAGEAIADKVGADLDVIYFDHTVGTEVDVGDVITLTVVMEGTNALTDPCSEGFRFHVRNAYTFQQFIGNGTSRLEDIDANTRRVVFEFDWTAVELAELSFPGGTNVFMGLCVDSDGDALAVHTNAITVVEP